MRTQKRLVSLLLCLGLVLVIVGCNTTQPSTPAPAPQPAATTGNADIQKQIDDIKSALPKFAIPMREVGSRFDNMYYAAKGGNWALAAYMSKYMDAAMNPAKVTKPNEYPAWRGFYDNTFKPVNDAIQAKDFTKFDSAYNSAIGACNGCHDGMGYKFIHVVKVPGPKDPHNDYSIKSEPGDVPK